MPYTCFVGSPLLVRKKPDILVHGILCALWRLSSCCLYNFQCVLVVVGKIPLDWNPLPSGNLTWLWKTTIFYGKLRSKWPFSIATLNYQRVLDLLVVSAEQIPLVACRIGHFCWTLLNTNPSFISKKTLVTLGACGDATKEYKSAWQRILRFGVDFDRLERWMKPDGSVWYIMLDRYIYIYNYTYIYI